MYTVGIDEAGRGALAGPVVVGAVALPKGISLKSGKLPPLRDSKKLSHRQRMIWFEYIRNHPEIFSTSARVYQGPIDKRNIVKSANLAASRALDRLLEQNPISTYSILLDGSLYLLYRRHKSMPARTIIRGDERFVSIKLASIVAKVVRDSYMINLHKRYPDYAFYRHKGYGTELHRNMIEEYGASDVHRLTYIKKWVE